MPTIDDIYGGNTLKAEDVPPNFRAVVQIESCAVHEFEDERKGTERKLVVRFAGKAKGLTLNVTNANMIAEITGTRDYTLWAGNHVTLYRTTTDFAGKRVPALRLDHPTAVPPAQRPAAPPPPPPPAQEFQASDDDVPFSVAVVPLLAGLVSLVV